MIRLLVIMGAISIISGCAPRTTMLTPGYYQPGAYAPSNYQPGYYDVYGNYHVPQDMAPTYEEPRYHRPMYGSVPPPPPAPYYASNRYGADQQGWLGQNWLTTPVVYGMVGGAALASLVTDGGLSNMLIGTAIGGMGGHVYQQRMDGQ